MKPRYIDTTIKATSVEDAVKQLAKLDRLQTAPRRLPPEEQELLDTERDLFNFLADLLRLKDEERTRLEELLHDYVKCRAEQGGQNAVDRKFNEGKYCRYCLMGTSCSSVGLHHRRASK